MESVALLREACRVLPVAVGSGDGTLPHTPEARRAARWALLLFLRAYHICPLAPVSDTRAMHHAYVDWLMETLRALTSDAEAALDSTLCEAVGSVLEVSQEHRLAQLRATIKAHSLLEDPSLQRALAAGLAAVQPPPAAAAGASTPAGPCPPLTAPQLRCFLCRRVVLLAFVVNTLVANEADMQRRGLAIPHVPAAQLAAFKAAAARCARAEAQLEPDSPASWKDAAMEALMSPDPRQAALAPRCYLRGFQLGREQRSDLWVISCGTSALHHPAPGQRDGPQLGADARPGRGRAGGRRGGGARARAQGSAAGVVGAAAGGRCAAVPPGAAGHAGAGAVVWRRGRRRPRL